MLAYLVLTTVNKKTNYCMYHDRPQFYEMPENCVIASVSVFEKTCVTTQKKRKKSLSVSVKELRALPHFEACRWKWSFWPMF